MIRNLTFCSLSFLFIMPLFSLSHYSTLNKQQKDNLSQLNIYNQPLQPCGTSIMSTGSWDPEYKCSQEQGGVHQICIERIGQTTNKFSLNTGQSDWSTQRGSQNHCVCLGAWSLYVARKNKNQISDSGLKQLKCDAIPRIALTKRYVKNFSKNPYYQGWQKWNGIELQNQVTDGVNELFNQCYSTQNSQQKQSLLKNYCDFGLGIDSIMKSQTYLTHCKSEKL